MDTKINLEIKEDKASINFEPALNQSTFVPLINNALNTMPQALLNMLTLVPILRPASNMEKEQKLYVFQDGEEGKVENDLYKYRKHLYDQIGAVFGQLLSTAFPDIEYIEGCKQHQQTFCMEHTEEEVKEYAKDVEKTTAYVREHFKEILEEVMSDDEEEEVKAS